MISRRFIDREGAARALRLFLGDAIEAAGGMDEFAIELAKMGYVGADGEPMSPRSIEQWVRDRKQVRKPPADLILAVAARYQMSVGRYLERQADAQAAKARAPREAERPDLADRLSALEDELAEMRKDYDEQLSFLMSKWHTEQSGVPQAPTRRDLQDHQARRRERA